MSLGFVVEHWRGRVELPDALHLEGRHGLFLRGVLLDANVAGMFVVGTGYVGWLVLLDAVMAVGKDFACGRRTSTLLGVALRG